MSSDLKKLFTTAENFKLLREKLGDYKKLPTKQEMRKFLDFLDDVYKIWKKTNPVIDIKRIEEKAKARRDFVYRLGIRR